MDLSGVEHHVVQGTNVHLQCIVIGARPAANVTWFNGSEPIREDMVITNAAVKVSTRNPLLSECLKNRQQYIGMSIIEEAKRIQFSPIFDTVRNIRLLIIAFTLSLRM